MLIEFEKLLEKKKTKEEKINFYNFYNKEKDPYILKLINNQRNIDFIDKIIKHKLGKSNMSEDKLINYCISFCESRKIEDIIKLVFFYEAVSAIGEKIITLLDIDDLFIKINKEINKLMPVDFLGITTYYRDTNEYVFRTIRNGYYEITPPKKMTDATAFSAYCIANNQPFIIKNIINEYKKYIPSIDTEGRGVTKPLSGIFYPLSVNDQVIGAIIVESIKENAYTKADLNIMKVFGRYVAIAMQNAVEYNIIENKSRYDSQTGLLTKEEILKEGLHLQQSLDNESKIFCILKIDMNDFKQINERYGYAIGDNILKLVTHTISKQIRGADIIGRYSGDEFLLICPKLRKTSSYKLAERIIKAINRINYSVHNERINISVSIGICEFNDKNQNFIENLIDVDNSMQFSKNDTNHIIITE